MHLESPIKGDVTLRVNGTEAKEYGWERSAFLRTCYVESAIGDELYPRIEYINGETDVIDFVIDGIVRDTHCISTSSYRRTMLNGCHIPDQKRGTIKLCKMAVKKRTEIDEPIDDEEPAPERTKVNPVGTIQVMIWKQIKDLSKRCILLNAPRAPTFADHSNWWERNSEFARVEVKESDQEIFFVPPKVTGGQTRNDQRDRVLQPRPGYRLALTVEFKYRAREDLEALGFELPPRTSPPEGSKLPGLADVLKKTAFSDKERSVSQTPVPTTEKSVSQDSVKKSNTAASQTSDPERAARTLDLDEQYDDDGGDAKRPGVTSALASAVDGGKNGPTQNGAEHRQISELPSPKSSMVVAEKPRSTKDRDDAGTAILSGPDTEHTSPQDVEKHVYGESNMDSVVTSNSMPKATQPAPAEDEMTGAGPVISSNSLGKVAKKLDDQTAVTASNSRPMASQNPAAQSLICPICLEPPTIPVITDCNHVFCKYCLEEAFRQSAADQSNDLGIILLCPVCYMLFRKAKPYKLLNGDPGSSGTQQKKAENRACDLCRTQKTKCQPDPKNPDGPCERCVKQRKTCVSTSLAPKTSRESSVAAKKASKKETAEKVDKHKTVKDTSAKVSPVKDTSIKSFAAAASGRTPTTLPTTGANIPYWEAMDLPSEEEQMQRIRDEEPWTTVTNTKKNGKSPGSRATSPMKKDDKVPGTSRNWITQPAGHVQTRTQRKQKTGEATETKKQRQNPNAPKANVPKTARSIFIETSLAPASIMQLSASTPQFPNPWDKPRLQNTRSAEDENRAWAHILQQPHGSLYAKPAPTKQPLANTLHVEGSPTAKYPSNHHDSDDEIFQLQPPNPAVKALPKQPSATIVPATKTPKGKGETRFRHWEMPLFNNRDSDDETNEKSNRRSKSKRKLSRSRGRRSGRSSSSSRQPKVMDTVESDAEDNPDNSDSDSSDSDHSDSDKSEFDNFASDKSAFSPSTKSSLIFPNIGSLGRPSVAPRRSPDRPSPAPRRPPRPRFSMWSPTPEPGRMRSPERGPALGGFLRHSRDRIRCTRCFTKKLKCNFKRPCHQCVDLDIECVPRQRKKWGAINGLPSKADKQPKLPAVGPDGQPLPKRGRGRPPKIRPESQEIVGTKAQRDARQREQNAQNMRGGSVLPPGPAYQPNPAHGSADVEMFIFPSPEPILFPPGPAYQPNGDYEYGDDEMFFFPPRYPDTGSRSYADALKPYSRSPSPISGHLSTGNLRMPPPPPPRSSGLGSTSLAAPSTQASRTLPSTLAKRKLGESGVGAGSDEQRSKIAKLKAIRDQVKAQVEKAQVMLNDEENEVKLLQEIASYEEQAEVIKDKMEDIARTKRELTLA